MKNQVTFERCRPEEAGITTRAILSFIESVESQGLELHGFMLLRHGLEAAGGWWHPYGPDEPHMLFSLSKSFTSTAVGMAIDEGILTVDDFVLDFFPEKLPDDPCENLRKMKVRHLLTMSTGHAEDVTEKMFAFKEDDWVGSFFCLPVEYEPGTHFIYNSAATYMLSAIITRVTGQTLADYLKPRLFDPLGIGEPFWETCPRGINTGGWGLNLRTGDIAKFGQLYLQKGVFGGKRILSEEWVREATSAQIDNSINGRLDWAQGYGYQFWRSRHNTYRGDGAFGQFCIVMPEKDAVLAITSGLNDMQAVLDLVWEHLLASMEDRALPLDDEAFIALQEKLSTLKLPPEGAAAGQNGEPDALGPADILSFSGRRYVLEDNGLNIKDITIVPGEYCCKLTLRTETGISEIELGYGRWAFGETASRAGQVDAAYGQIPADVAASCAWRGGNDLAIALRYYKTPFSDMGSLHFEGDSLELTLNRNLSFGPIVPHILKGRAV